MDFYPKSLRDVPDADLAELVAERDCLDHCNALERELIVRWLAARDVIEWLQEQASDPAPLPGPGPCPWLPRQRPECRAGGRAAHGPRAAAPRAEGRVAAHGRGAAAKSKLP